mmetsp:Transcript_116419/g.340569  ORF Transcript_116419/g.340569 Transcript_116419/m.340569 type:complete len:310 (+) Transcript_116419:369-1298(+)
MRAQYERLTGIEATVDVQLLECRRTVASHATPLTQRRHLHSLDNLKSERATASGIEGNSGTRGHQCVNQVLLICLQRSVDNVLSTDGLEQVRLLLSPHHVHQRNAVSKADLHEHLAQLAGGGRVHDAGVALGLHCLDHAEGCQRVDPRGRSILGGRTLQVLNALPDVDDGVLPIAAAHAHARHELPLQALRALALAGADYAASALVACAHGLANHRARNGAERLVVHRQGGDAVAGRVDGSLGTVEAADPTVGGCEQRPDVAGVDGRGLNGHQHLVILEGSLTWDFSLGDTELQEALSILLDDRASEAQ